VNADRSMDGSETEVFRFNDIFRASDDITNIHPGQGSNSCDDPRS
jgi:hypothetical protein